MKYVLITVFTVFSFQLAAQYRFENKTVGAGNEKVKVSYVKAGFGVSDEVLKKTELDQTEQAKPQNKVNVVTSSSVNRTYLKHKSKRSNSVELARGRAPLNNNIIRKVKYDGSDI